jgi:hypothetical protein
VTGRGGSVYPVDHDRVRRDAGADRRNRLLPSHAPAGGVAWAAGLGRRANSLVRGRENPAVTEKRRETVEGLKWRISCIHRMHSSRCGRRAASGSRS